MTPPFSPPAAPMSAADEAAHEAGSYVRREAFSYTDAARAVHDQDCTRCRTLTEEGEARAAAYGESIRRRDRQQLGLLRVTTKSVQ